MSCHTWYDVILRQVDQKASAMWRLGCLFPAKVMPAFGHSKVYGTGGRVTPSGGRVSRQDSANIKQAPNVDEWTRCPFCCPMVLCRSLEPRINFRSVCLWRAHDRLQETAAHTTRNRLTCKRSVFVAFAVGGECSASKEWKSKFTYGLTVETSKPLSKQHPWSHEHVISNYKKTYKNSPHLITNGDASKLACSGFATGRSKVSSQTGSKFFTFTVEPGISHDGSHTIVDSNPSRWTLIGKTEPETEWNNEWFLQRCAKYRVSTNLPDFQGSQALQATLPCASSF